MRWLRPGKVVHWTRLALGMWHREYHDSRIILEQQGDLKYLVIPARFQRNLARTLLVTVSATAVLLVGMSLADVDGDGLDAVLVGQ